jgi:SAM-dependent methyltransferase
MQRARQAYRIIRERAVALRFHLAPLFGRKGFYDIASGYRHRPETHYFDDTENADEWQREVYVTARQIMLQRDLKTACDVGCGGGYKLVHILGEFETTGIDLPETIARVRERYPSRLWLAASFETLEAPRADLVICADVIEHVSDPDLLMRFIVATGAQWIVISTPDRDRLYGGKGLCRFGPPGNPAHVREWTMREFGSYMGRFLHIVRHEISNEEQATQMIVGRPRSLDHEK